MTDGSPATGPEQSAVQAWLEDCFGAEAARNNPMERALRFLEEALEAVQSAGVTREEAHALVDYVFDRPVEPEIAKEFGGVFTTALVFAEAMGLDFYECGRREFARCLARVEEIRVKQARKPDNVKGTPLDDGAGGT